MAILRSIVAGLLALLLALPSPALCYADVVAGEGVNHVSEAQNSQEDGESFEDQSEANKSSEPEGSNGQRSNSNESSRSSSGDGAALSASSDSSQEGLENGDLVDNAAVRSNGFDPSDYPSEYSDPSINNYLGFTRDDLQEAIKQFYDFSESRELTDDENYQATLALFAWYYLDYGSTDDLVQAAVSSDWIINSIVGLMGFSTKDLAYTIIYSLFGSPGTWGANAPYDVYSVKGIAWYIANIDSKTSSIYSHLANIYNRLGSTNQFLVSIRDNTSNLYDRLNTTNTLLLSARDTINDIYARLGSTNTFLLSARDTINDIYARLESTNLFLKSIRDNSSLIYTRLDTTNSLLLSSRDNLSSIFARLESTNVFLKSIRDNLNIYFYDSSTNRSWLQVIGDRFTSFMYLYDAAQVELLKHIDILAKDETVSSGFNTLDSHVLLYLFGNNNGLPAYTEFLDNGLIYYIVQIHDDNKAFFDAALEFLEYMKDRLFYIEYDLVDYGMDIEPGFNRVIEAINTKQFDIQLDNAEVSINLSGVESRLDTIISMLGIAGAKDLLENFLGDFNLDASSALAGAISSAMQNVFPFCIPAILKQCLGLMQAEAHAPVFEFDFFGSPLVLDFTAQGFCDISQVTSWFCRISFLILLLVNTKKFIFTINNRGAQDG